MGISANNFVILELIKDGSIMYTRKLKASEATTFDYTVPATGEYTWRMRSSSIGTTTTQPLTYSLDNLSIFYTYPYTVENCDNLADGYRFGFNGQEKESDIYGESNVYEFKFRIHDARTGRFLSQDPLFKEYPWNSPYAFAENRVIDGVDLEGKEWKIATIDPTTGKTVVQITNTPQTPTLDRDEQAWFDLVTNSANPNPNINNNTADFNNSVFFFNEKFGANTPENAYKPTNEYQGRFLKPVYIKESQSFVKAPQISVDLHNAIVNYLINAGQAEMNSFTTQSNGQTPIQSFVNTRTTLTSNDNNQGFNTPFQPTGFTISVNNFYRETAQEAFRQGAYPETNTGKDYINANSQQAQVTVFRRDPSNNGQPIKSKATIPR